MDDQLAPLRAANVVSLLQRLIEEHGNLPVTFGDDGSFIRSIEAMEVPTERRAGRSLEFFCIGW